METRVPGPGGGSLQFPSAVETEMAVPEVQLPTPSQAVPVMDLRVATPGLNSGELDGFTLDTWTLVDSVVQTAINRRQPTGTPAGNSHQVILHGVEKTRRDNRGEFEDMCSHLLLSSANIYLSVQQIFEGMFDDHTINWGRINVLLAFGGHLAHHCLMNGMGEVVESLTPWMTAFICTRLREWILEHGGWAGLAQLRQQQTQRPQGGWLQMATSGMELEVGMARRRTTNEIEDEEKLIENEEDFEVASKTSSSSTSSSISIKITVSDLEEESNAPHHQRVKEERHLIRIPLSVKHRLNSLRSTRGKRVYWWVTVAGLCVLVILALSIPLGLWENRSKQKCLDFEDVPEEEYEEFPFLLDGIIGGNASFELCQRGETKLKATLGLNHRFIQEVKVDFYNFSRNTLLNVTRANKNCLRVEWVGTGTADAPLKDCYQIGNEFWYAGYETYTQKWPINADSSYYSPLMPFLPHDYLFDSFANFGPVLHPLWLSSNGSAIVVDRDVQLYVSIDNDTKEICLHARPFELDCIPQASSKAVLSYTVCVFENTADAAKYILNASGLIEHPKSIPDAEVFRKPIWSTWAKYKTNINDSALQNFHQEIIDNNFSISQLEIDDGYSVHYGELKFNNYSSKFSTQNLSTLASQVNLTAWVHPFINSDANVFHDAVQEDYFLPGYSEIEGNSVSLVKWWHEYGAVINFLNSNASHWHGARLENFLNKNSLTSLKFDAGEFTYLPKCVYIKGNDHPADFTVAYARFVGNRSYSSRAEVRVGYFTQDQPMFVRMLDKISTWGLDNGLQSVLTTALTFGIAGYPFVLPDMIGGNGGNGTATSQSDTILPDLELYVRWVQLNAFLPVMQFSIAPWQFNNISVVENAHKMVNLHMSLSSVIINLARDACQTSHPIVRPLWWIVRDADPKIWTIYDQFLIGDDIMVAPILEKAQTTRQVYFPRGTWWKVELPEGEKQCKPTNFCGDGDTKTFSVSLWDTLYFSRVYQNS